MNTHESYISLETAKMLKEAKFDWECEYAILPTTEMGDTPYQYNQGRTNNYNDKEKYQFEIYSAPSLDVAQRWLREVKGMELDICWHINLDNQYKYAYAIKVKSIRKCLDKGKEIEVPSMDCLDAETCFDTYEEVQEAGIKKALEIILEKGK